ncbi:MAG: 2-hydroxyacyl-CoA dehydratase family protein [Lachnospiraceae bacterium]
MEDYFIDQAESVGIAATLCSYHKNFIGGVDAGVVPKALRSVTTSMICDGNVNTFRYLEEKHQVPSFVLDIPDEYSEDAENYVVEQLKELIRGAGGAHRQKTGSGGAGNELWSGKMSLSGFIAPS